MQTKEISLNQGLFVIFLAAALTAGAFICQQPLMVAKTAPVFSGEELVIKTVTANRPIALEPTKVLANPLSMPTLATPLPIMPPRIIAQILPVYPETALEKNLSGVVLLSVYVGMSGTPERLETKTSSGFVELDEAARAAVATWKFSPATQGGAALASWFEVPVRFLLK